MGAIRYSGPIRPVPTYILPAKKIRLLGKFHPDSFLTERRVCVETDMLIKNRYTLWGRNVSFTALQTSDWNHYTLCLQTSDWNQYTLCKGIKTFVEQHFTTLRIWPVVILLPVGEVNRPPAVIFWGFLYFTFLFSLRFERTPIKIKSLIFWAAANDVSWNSLAKSGIVSVISLAHLSTALKNRPDENP